MKNSEHIVGPNQAVDDRVLEILKEPSITIRSPEEWARIRSRAWTDQNLLEATALTYAQYLLNHRAKHRETVPAPSM